MIDWIIRVQCSRTHHNIWPKLFGTDHHSHRVWTRLNQADLKFIGSGRQHKREMISKHGNDSQWKQEQRKYLEKRHQRKFMRPGSLCAVRLELRVESLNLGERVRLKHFQFRIFNSEFSNLIGNSTSAWNIFPTWKFKSFKYKMVYLLGCLHFQCQNGKWFTANQNFFFLFDTENEVMIDMWWHIWYCGIIAPAHSLWIHK